MTESQSASPISFHVGEFLKDEMDARGWTAEDVARRMGGDDPRVDLLCVELTIHVDDPGLLLDETTSEKLGRAFGVSPKFFSRLDQAYRQHAAERRSNG